MPRGSFKHSRISDLDAESRPEGEPALEDHYDCRNEVTTLWGLTNGAHVSELDKKRARARVNIVALTLKGSNSSYCRGIIFS